MTLSLVLFLTLRFRRSPSTHALVSRVVVVVGVAVAAAVALFGVAVLARLHERQLTGAATTEQSAPVRIPLPQFIDHDPANDTSFEDTSNDDISSDGYITSDFDTTSDDDQTV